MLSKLVDAEENGISAGFDADGSKEIGQAANLVMDLTTLKRSEDEIAQAKNSVEWLDKEEELERKLESLKSLQESIDVNNCESIIPYFKSDDYTLTDVMCAIVRSNSSVAQKDALIDALKNNDIDVELGYSKSTANFITLSKDLSGYDVNDSEQKQLLIEIYASCSTNEMRRKTIFAELLASYFDYESIIAAIQAINVQGSDTKGLLVKVVVCRLSNALEGVSISNWDFQAELQCVAGVLMKYATSSNEYLEQDIYTAFVDEFDESDLPDDEIDFIVDTVWECLNEELNVYEMVAKADIDGLVNFINSAKNGGDVLGITELEWIAKCLINYSIPAERDAILEALTSKGHDLNSRVARLLSDKLENSMTSDEMLIELRKHTNNINIVNFAIWHLLESKMTMKDDELGITNVENFITSLEGKGYDVSYLKHQLAITKILAAHEEKDLKRIDAILNTCGDDKQDIILEFFALLGRSDFDVFLVILKHANDITQQRMLAESVHSFGLAHIIMNELYGEVKPMLKDGVLEQVIAPVGNAYGRTPLAVCIREGFMQPFLDLRDDAKKEVLKSRIYKDGQHYSPVVNAIQIGSPLTQKTILEQFGKEGILGLFEDTGVHPLGIGGVKFGINLFETAFKILGDDTRKQDLIKGSNKCNVLASIMNYGRDNGQIRELIKILFEHANPDTRKHLIFHTYDSLDVDDSTSKNASFFRWIGQEGIRNFLMINDHRGFRQVLDSLTSHLVQVDNDLTSAAQFVGTEDMSAKVKHCMESLRSIINDGYTNYVKSHSSQYRYYI